LKNFYRSYFRIIYGLATEHTLKILVVLKCNNGILMFSQSEYPYDVNKDWDYLLLHAMEITFM